MSRAYFRDEKSRFATLLSGVPLHPARESAPVGEGASIEPAIVELLRPHMLCYTNARTALDWNPWEARIVPAQAVDFVGADFSSGGRLLALRPYLQRGPGFPPLPSERDARQVTAALVAAYNDTADRADRRRPAALAAHLARRLRREGLGNQRAFARRLTQATWMSTVPGRRTDRESATRARATPPDFLERRHPGQGGLVVLHRPVQEGQTYDLWFSASHPIWDGGPFMDLLDDLRNALGERDALRVPAELLETGAESRLSGSTPGPRAEVLLHAFIDFSPFKERRDLLAAKAGARVPIPALLLWGLSLHPIFRGKKFLLPVDLPATGARERTMGITFIRPEKHREGTTEDTGFRHFLDEYHRNLAAIRARSGPYYDFAEGMANFPAPTYSAVRRLFPNGLEACFGSTGITMLRRTEMSLVTGDDYHVDGYVSFGNMDVPVEDGRRACSVSVRAPRDRAQAMLEAARLTAEARSLPRP